MAIAYFNASRVHLQEYIAAFAAQTESQMRLLDAGAGDAPYKKLFAHAIYETADLQTVDKPYATTDYICDLRNIPVPDNSFDRILFNQVMEHVPDPRAVLVELHRVLKPGGRIFCSAPLCYEEHEQPYDFYRYTQFGHKYLFNEAKFEIDSIEWMEGYLGTLGYQLWRGSKQLPLWHGRSGNILSRIALLPVFLIIRCMLFAASAILSRLDTRLKIVDRGSPLNYVVLAHKPAHAASHKH